MAICSNKPDSTNQNDQLAHMFACLLHSVIRSKSKIWRKKEKHKQTKNQVMLWADLRNHMNVYPQVGSSKKTLLLSI